MSLAQNGGERLNIEDPLEQLTQQTDSANNQGGVNYSQRFSTNFGWIMNGFGRKRQIIYYLCRQDIGRGEKNDHWLV